MRRAAMCLPGYRQEPFRATMSSAIDNAEQDPFL